MDFNIQHTLTGDFDTVVRTALDERIFPILQARMQTVIEIEALEVRREGATLHRRIRYLPKPLIQSVGPKKIEPKSLEWIEVSRFDFNTLKGEFENQATSRKLKPMLVNHGTLAFERLPDGKVQRTVAGSLELKVGLLLRPFVPIALRLIHKNAAAILDDEARVLQQVLDEGLLKP